MMEFCTPRDLISILYYVEEKKALGKTMVFAAFPTRASTWDLVSSLIFVQREFLPCLITGRAMMSRTNSPSLRMAARDL